MKLLIALLFVLPLSAQAGHHKGKKHGSKRHKHHRYHKKIQYYLTVGTALDFSKKTVGEKKTTSYAIHLGKGMIFKKKYDLSFLLKYEKGDADTKSYGFNIATKYLLHKKLTKRSKMFKGHVPYVGVGYELDKIEDKTSKAFGVSVGNRFPVSRNMKMALDYTYSLGKLPAKQKSKASRITMNWYYFF